MGTAVTMVRAGVVEKTNINKDGPAAPPDETRCYRLGITRQTYRKTDECDIVRAFQEACADQRAAWLATLKQTDVRKAIDQINNIVGAVSAATVVFDATANDSSTRLLLVRKLFLVCVNVGAIDADWENISVRTLTAMVPDQHEFLDTLPQTWTAAQASDFILGRPDMPMFIGIFASLFHDAAKTKKWETDPHQMLEIIRKGDFLRTALRMAANNGHHCCPKLILEELHPATARGESRKAEAGRKRSVG